MNVSSIASSAAYTAQSNLSSGPKVPNLLEGKKESAQPVDTFELSSEPGRTSMNNAGMNDGKTDPAKEKQFREVFHKFIGTTIYGQMLKAMRQTQTKPAYFDGGRAEEIFQQQLDQVIADKMSSASSKSMSEAMFKGMKRNTE